jgi:hypothetical protein
MNDPIDRKLRKGSGRHVEDGASRRMDLGTSILQELNEPAADEAAATRHKQAVCHKKRFRSFSNSMVARS